MITTNQNVRYANVLTDAINKAGYTYQQVSDKCKSCKVPVSKSYISKLASGILPPASDDVNRVLVEVLGPKSGLTYKDITIAKYKEIIPVEILEMLKRA
ncbi:hypothetical protein [Paenibacillus shenyangensis]|uniref:hypothetical protein n=1 Tax=Paenibacillus sp. A9 TaxID=1284352 RepID=UPI00036EA3C0|nr:hypothetical protein [Paenibacillus sp. A9]